MVEARENIDLVTIRRQSDVDTSQRTYERLQAEAAAVAADTDEDTGNDTEDSVSTAAIMRPPAATIDPAIALNRVRLGVISALALTLLLLLIVQRRHGQKRKSFRPTGTFANG